MNTQIRFALEPAKKYRKIYKRIILGKILSIPYTIYHIASYTLHNSYTFGTLGECHCSGSKKIKLYIKLVKKSV